MLYKILDKAYEKLNSNSKVPVTYVYLNKDCHPFGIISACKNVLSAFLSYHHCDACVILNDYYNNMSGNLSDSLQSRLKFRIAQLKEFSYFPVKISVLPENELIPANVPVLQVECEEKSLTWLVEPIAECIRDELERIANEHVTVKSIYDVMKSWTSYCNASENVLSNSVVSLESDSNIHPWGLYFNGNISFVQANSLIKLYKWGSDDLCIMRFISKKYIDSLIALKKVECSNENAEVSVLKNIFKTMHGLCCVEYSFTEGILKELKEIILSNLDTTFVLKDTERTSTLGILGEKVEEFNCLNQARNVFHLSEYNGRCKYFYCKKEGSYYERTNLDGGRGVKKLDVESISKIPGFADKLENIFGVDTSDGGFKCFKNVAIYVDFIHSIKDLESFMTSAVKENKYCLSCFKIGLSIDDFEKNENTVSVTAESPCYDNKMISSNLGGLQMVVQTNGVYNSVTVDKVLGTSLKPLIYTGESGLRKLYSSDYRDFVKPFR